MVIEQLLRGKREEILRIAAHHGARAKVVQTVLAKISALAIAANAKAREDNVNRVLEN